MKTKIAALVSEHRLMLALCVLFVALRLPLAGMTREFILTDQDYNPTNFGLLYLHNDLPPADDVDVGENARTLSLSSAYYYVPLAFFKLGVPFEFFDALQLVLGLPLFLLGLYVIAFALSRNPGHAAFAALFFYLNEWIFNLNIGYPILFDKTLYSGDVNHIPAAFFLGFFLLGRPVAAGVCSCALTLLNPTYGVGAALALFLDLARRAAARRPWRRAAAGAGIALAGMAAAYVMVRLSTPQSAPVPREVRDFCIRVYGHFTPHVFSALKYLANAVFLGAVLGAAAWYETRRRKAGPGPDADARAAGVHLIAFIFLAFGIGVYFLLYVVSPSLFIMLCPSKSWFLAIMLAGMYLGLGLAHIVARNTWYTTAGFLGIYLVLLRVNQGSCFISWHRADHRALLALACVLAAAGWALGARRRAPSGPAMALAAALVLLGGFSASAMLGVKNNPHLKYAAALYDLEREIRAALPADAMIVPYRAPGSHNPYGPFTSWPIRTYSRRGGLVFWVVGRNAYFDSRTIMQREQRAFATAGMDLWPGLLRESRRLRKQDPLLYYTGVSLRNGLRITNQKTPPLGMFDQLINTYMASVQAWDFETYLKYAGQIGATHVVVCRDPHHPGPAARAVLQNPYFTVVPAAK